jgi:hypothetical protein
MSKITIIEGAKNVGKTFLLSQVKGKQIYKFPFADYFNEFMKGEDFNKSTADVSAYHFSTAFDVSLLSMNKLGLLTEDNVIIDRGFLSNIVLGILQERITWDTARDYIIYLSNRGWLKDVQILYVQTEVSNDRNKDAWEHLSSDMQRRMYDACFNILAEVAPEVEIKIFNNNFDSESIDNFITLINE